MTIVRPIDDPMITRTAALLGGPKVFAHAVTNRFAAHDLLEKGLPGDALLHLMASVETLNPVRLQKAVGISLRTYQRHKEAPKKRLSPEQSGRTWKFAEIFARVIDVFGSQNEAEDWLQKPAIALENRAPIDLLSTPTGTDTVEHLLTRLEHGVYT